MKETQSELKSLKEIFGAILFVLTMFIILYVTITTFIFSTAYLSKKYKELFENQQNIEMIDKQIEKDGK